MRYRRLTAAIALFLLVSGATACSQQANNEIAHEPVTAEEDLDGGIVPASTAQPTETVAPTTVPEPTATTVPTETATPEPTNTTEPTATPTPVPTNTAAPTDTPQPTHTPVPTEPALAVSPGDVFTGLQLFSYAGAETHEDPDDIMSDYLPIDIDDVVSNSILYRYYYTEGQTPARLNQDICPGDLYTAWYSFETGSPVPIRIGMTVEVHSTSDAYLSWFSPIYMDEYTDAAGNPTFDPPLYVAMCLDPQNRHYHTIFVSNESMNLDVPVTCRIVVNDNGQLIESVGLGPEWSDVTGPVLQTCWYDEE